MKKWTSLFLSVLLLCQLCAAGISATDPVLPFDQAVADAIDVALLMYTEIG
jgi:hypothetical protein